MYKSLITTIICMLSVQTMTKILKLKQKHHTYSSNCTNMKCPHWNTNKALLTEQESLKNTWVRKMTLHLSSWDITLCKVRALNESHNTGYKFVCSRKILNISESHATHAKRCLFLSPSPTGKNQYQTGLNKSKML